jgi:hypothetical protein
MVSPPHPWIHGRRSDHLRGVTSNIHQRKTCFSLMDINYLLIWAAIHLAVRVSTGEANEIAALLIAAFA